MRERGTASMTQNTPQNSSECRFAALPSTSRDASGVRTVRSAITTRAGIHPTTSRVARNTTAATTPAARQLSAVIDSAHHSSGTTSTVTIASSRGIRCRYPAYGCRSVAACDPDAALARNSRPSSAQSVSRAVASSRIHAAIAASSPIITAATGPVIQRDIPGTRAARTPMTWTALTGASRTRTA